MFDYAWKALFRSPVRLALLLLGVAFSSFLVIAQVGVFLGFVGVTSSIISNGAADLWVTLRNSPNFQTSRPFQVNRLYMVKASPGVEKASELLQSFMPMKNRRGGVDLVGVVGYDIASGLGAPWDIEQGSLDELKIPKDVFLSDSPNRDTWGYKTGDQVEVAGNMVKIVGLVRGVRTLNGAPYLFCSTETYRRLTAETSPDQVHFILARVAPGFNRAEVAETLRRKMKNVDVLDRDSYRLRTEMYWSVQTGIGYGFLFTAILGLFVGMIIVGQVLYAATVEQLPQYGTLRAIGASHRDVYLILVYQACIVICGGFALGTLVACIVSAVARHEDLIIRIDAPTLAGAFVATAACCLGSTVAAIRKAISVDPAIVFRG